MPAAKVAQTPNILVMMVDQMRAAAMGCAGNEHIRTRSGRATPGLDRLAREGMRFSHCLTPVPVCIAARHGMMTGQRCAVHGRFGNNVPNPEPLLYTLQQLLGSAGYLTRAIGKMHFRPVRRHHGFQRMELMEEIPDYRQDDEYLKYLKDHGYGHVREVHGVRNLLYHLPQVSVLPEAHHGSTWVADRTIDFLCQNRERPFYCWSSWIAPHPPWNPPEPFASMVPPAEMPLPRDFERPAETLPPQMRRLKNFAYMGDAPAERLQRVKALYYGSISLIDKGVGRILRALDDLGLTENTLVIFTSDHGEMLGDFGCWQKSNPYEAATRVPLLVRLPGRSAPGAVCDDLVSLLDIMPTALDVAKVDYPGSPPLPGASLFGRPGGGLADKREEMVVEEGRGQSRWLSLRRGTWKYNYWLRDGWEELYDLEADPNERSNLLLRSAAPEHRERAGAMKAALTDWEKAQGFSDSLDDSGAPGSTTLVNHHVPPPDPAEHRINTQFPRWVDRLPPEERACMESRGETVVGAIRFEDTFALEDLDLRPWKAAGGSLEGTPQQRLLDELD